PTAALRTRRTGAGGAAPARPPGGARNGVVEDLRREAAALGLDARQQAALDEAMAAIEARQRARQAAPAAGAGQRGPGGPMGGMRGPAGGATGMPPQVRQRMAQRFKEDFAGFRATLRSEERRV